MSIKESLQNFSVSKSLSAIAHWLVSHVPSMSAASLHLLAVILIHAATLPSLMAVMFGLSDKMPALDMVILIWAGLMAMFAQAMVMRNFLIAVVISLGFMAQSITMALIFFK